MTTDGDVSTPDPAKDAHLDTLRKADEVLEDAGRSIERERGRLQRITDEYEERLRDPRH